MHAQDTAAVATADTSLLAAIDLGSKSFHIIIARVFAGELSTLDVVSGKVQLAAGLDAEICLTEATMARGLECMRRFAQRIADLPRQSIRVVGSNALLEARNSDVLIARSEALLRTPVEIIAGR